MGTFRLKRPITWASLTSGHFLERKLQRTKGSDFPYKLLKFSTNFYFLPITIKLGHRQATVTGSRPTTYYVCRCYLRHIRRHRTFHVRVYRVPNALQIKKANSVAVHVASYLLCKFDNSIMKRVKDISTAHIGHLSIHSFKLHGGTIAFILTLTQNVIYKTKVWFIANTLHALISSLPFFLVTAHTLKIYGERVTHLVTRRISENTNAMGVKFRMQ